MPEAGNFILPLFPLYLLMPRVTPTLHSSITPSHGQGTIWNSRGWTLSVTALPFVLSFWPLLSCLSKKCLQCFLQNWFQDCCLSLKFCICPSDPNDNLAGETIPANMFSSLRFFFFFFVLLILFWLIESHLIDVLWILWVPFVCKCFFWVCFQYYLLFFYSVHTLS